jgi:hypothetical protein
MSDLQQTLREYAYATQDPGINLRLATLYHDLGHTAAAITYYVKTAELSHDDALSYACLIRAAQCFEQQGHRHISVRSLAKRAMVLLPRRPEAYWYLAKFNESTGQHSDCYLLCCQALEFCDHDLGELPVTVGYPGSWAFDFQRSVSSWWWGMNDHSRQLLRDLFDRHWHSMDANYQRTLLVNLRRVGDQQLFFEREYQEACDRPSDINEHLPTLRQLAEQCEHITEMGVRTGVSTRAFLASGRVLRAYDIRPDAGVQLLFDQANTLGRDAVYAQADVLKIGIDETDLLFIDTLHNYDQLRQELALHASRARRYLVFHDTETFGSRDEVGSGPGLNLAIQQFLDTNSQWRLHLRRTQNNGLTVLIRC